MYKHIPDKNIRMKPQI